MELRWVWDRHELETPTCYAILWDIRTHHIYMYIHVCVCFCSPASPFRHGPTTLPLMAKVYCTFVLCMAMFGLLIPKCSKPQTKRAQKKTQKYANNPQKPAKANNLQFRCFLSWTKFDFCFGELTNRSFQCSIRAISVGSSKRLAYFRLGGKKLTDWDLH